LQKQQQEEAERKREMEQQAEMVRKQAEFERQKQKLQQEQLNRLKLPSHAQWAKQQASLLPNVNLKSVLEQQALEQKMIEQMKQVEALNQQQNSSSSTWSSLFRGQQQSPPNVGSSQTVSLTNIQTEQKNTEKIVAAAQKSQSKPVQQSSSKQPWTSWANTPNNNSKTQTNDNNEGFWTEVTETKPKQSNPKQQGQVKAPPKEPEQKKSNKKLQENASVQQKILHNMTISEEFMKWCHDQLKDFQADCKPKHLHIPTFVNFLREIETCAEIEDYVINYLGESKQAKDFAQQFFINRESQLSQQTNSKQLHDDPSSQFNLREGSFSTKQKQKRRSKGQKLDSQLLGFTVQPDPSLKNRGDIDML
ncbi:PERQ amino acid-rich with GYF domain-containing 2 isoform X1, partial [Brachionus plicatilis]